MPYKRDSYSDSEFEIDLDNRLVTPGDLPEDGAVENSLRPHRLSDYVGQERSKDNLRVFMQAAKTRGEPLDHVLLHGPPGLGKTTLAGIISAEMGGTMRITSGPAIEKAGDLAALLTTLETGDVLFIDEIHRLSRTVEEVLYSALEDFAIDIILGKGPSARSIRLDLNRFTLIGATTRFGQLSGPLRDRFSVLLKLDPYTVPELIQIVSRSSRVLGIPIESDGAAEIASRARGTPRIANRLLKRVRDFAQVEGGGVINETIAKAALTRLEVDELGLDNIDKRLLTSIIVNYGGGPVGLDTLAATVGEESITIEEVYEPYLLQIGFLTRTPRGRCVTRLVYDHLGIKPPAAESAQITWR